MKAEKMKERPNYELFKQNDIVNFYHLQYPHWLVDDGRYRKMSMEAKFTYMFLFNRFQLSKHNGWVNENGEVFVIYTRKELAEQTNISEKRISAAMSELRDYMLIWERRCGRGFANQIYLANVKVSLNDALKSKSGPLDPRDESVDESENAEDESEDLRPDETAVLNGDDFERENALTAGKWDDNVDNNRKSSCFPHVTEETAVPEPQLRKFKTSQNSGSKTVVPSAQDPPNRPPNKKDFSYFNKSFNNQSQSESSPYTACARNGTSNGQTDADAIKTLLQQAELEAFSEDEATVMKDAIERLYFMQNIKIGGAVYPNERIRSHLFRLNALVIEDAINKITKNTTAKIRNSSAYVVTVLFNTIMETASDLIVDPYLNSLRAIRMKPVLEGGG